ncbi:hypothetical protein RvY_01959 [Ramazzottius varieornatus]|uniref:Uncharacterized protein n=1 Tax=Ramazzottius varieornatus TaxID=947166 RepID=A0A1D1UTA5_RAMVA|nr:hypothetical protein RvY_01959 [Ramazzottius varieornatus]
MDGKFGGGDGEARGSDGGGGRRGMGGLAMPFPAVPKHRALLERFGNFSHPPLLNSSIGNSSTGSWQYGVPCYLLGRPELAYVYFGVGFLLAIALALIVDHQTIFQFFRRLLSCGDLPEDLDDVDYRHTHGRKHDANEPEKEPLQDKATDDTTPNSITFRKQIRELARKKRTRWPVRAFIVSAASEHNLIGRLWMSLGVICSGISLSIHLWLASVKNQTIEACAERNHALHWIDLAVNVYLLIYFLIRVLGREKKLPAVLSFHSLVDYFHVPNAVVDPWLCRQFIGFGFLRVYNFGGWLLDLAVATGLLRSANKTKVFRLIFVVTSLTMVASGFLHLAENIGDPLLYAPDGEDLYNGQPTGFWKCFLYIYGRVSMLDLSYMQVRTATGRIIIYSFQLLALGVVAKAIPVIADYMKVKPEYQRSYHPSSSYLHIILTGHVTAYNFKYFVREFYEKERIRSKYFKIVVLSDNPPDAAIKTQLLLHHTKVYYRQGSMLKLEDLHRVALTEAAATLILCSRHTFDPDADDAANIMRVVSAKNLKHNARVIVELHHFHNKPHVLNTPHWSPLNGDSVICLAELQLGLLAQSCVAQGFSTLMANLFTTRSSRSKIKHKKSWMDDYQRGTRFEIYYRKFSPFFVGMNFQEASIFCYRRLKLVLLATHHNPEQCACSATIDGIAGGGTITTDTIGFFLGERSSKVDRVRVYCKNCHENVELSAIKKCKCHMPTAREAKKSSTHTVEELPSRTELEANSALEVETKKNMSCPNVSPADTLATSCTKNPPGGPSELCLAMGCDQPINGHQQLDSTGMFYWVPAPDISTVIVDVKKESSKTFSNHIVLCVLAGKENEAIGLANFVLPLRSAAIPYEELHDILLVSNKGFLEKEWPVIGNLPQIYILEGSALKRGDLRRASLMTCKMCVIMSAPTVSRDLKDQDPALLDKSVILATANVRTTSFSKEGVPAESRANPLESKSPLWKHGSEVPLITDLARETNVVFLDDDDTDSSTREFYLTQPYSEGRAFTNSVLDLLMVMCFFDPFLVSVVEGMIFGPISKELENVLAEGDGLIDSEVGMNIPLERKPDRVRIVQPSVEDVLESLNAQEKVNTYGQVYVELLRTRNITSLGVFRRTDGRRKNQRFVMCNPPQDTLLHDDDLLIALQHF